MIFIRPSINDLSRCMTVSLTCTIVLLLTNTQNAHYYYYSDSSLDPSRSPCVPTSLRQTNRRRFPLVVGWRLLLLAIGLAQYHRSANECSKNPNAVPQHHNTTQILHFAKRNHWRRNSRVCAFGGVAHVNTHGTRHLYSLLSRNTLSRIWRSAWFVWDAFIFCWHISCYVRICLDSYRSSKCNDSLRDIDMQLDFVGVHSNQKSFNSLITHW